MKTTPSKFKPFNLVTRDDNKVVIVAGNTQASPNEFDNVLQAEKYLSAQPFEMCINLISILLYYENKDKEQNPQGVEKGA